MLALFGITFLTPLAALFALAGAAPLAALLVTERRATKIRSLLGVAGRSRQTIVAAVALVLTALLVGAAAAQPVVVHRVRVGERADAQAFFVLDTSLSMRASAAPGAPTRLARAKELALRLERALPDVPVGIISMTDRALPNAMPTTDTAVFERTLRQSVGINRPPPSQVYAGRATTFQALVPILGASLYSRSARERLLVVFTDGEASAISPLLRYALRSQVTAVFVHVWRPGERIFRRGRPAPGYLADPSSSRQLDQLSALTGGKTVDENDFAGLEHAARRAIGRGETRSQVDAYARIALAPWLVLGCVAPLGFLLWRRNL